MASPFLGQIELFSFPFPPKGWMPCAGQILAIAQNSALFSLLGTTFGGNGVTTFALPDLRGVAPMGQGNGPGLSPRPLGTTVGEQSVTLTVATNPSHNHLLGVISNPDLAQNVYTPDSTQLLAQTTGKDSNGAQLTFNIYAPDPAPNQLMGASAIGATGGQPHNNMMPYLAGNFCIALVGVYPSRP